jgi:hypothetical protein
MTCEVTIVAAPRESAANFILRDCCQSVQRRSHDAPLQLVSIT